MNKHLKLHLVQDMKDIKTKDEAIGVACKYLHWADENSEDNEEIALEEQKHTLSDKYGWIAYVLFILGLLVGAAIMAWIFI